MSESSLPSWPPRSVAEVCDDLRFEAIVETAELAASYARSAAESAWRGDKLTLGVHLRRLRLAVVLALQTFNQIGAESGGRETAG